MAKKITVDDIELTGSIMKVVVLFEVRPLTDQFEQIMLTKKQANAVRDAIWRTSPTCKDCGGRQITTNDGHHVMLPDIRPEYTEEEIAAAACPL